MVIGYIQICQENQDKKINLRKIPSGLVTVDSVSVSLCESNEVSCALSDIFWCVPKNIYSIKYLQNYSLSK